MLVASPAALLAIGLIVVAIHILLCIRGAFARRPRRTSTTFAGVGASSLPFECLERRAVSRRRRRWHFGDELGRFQATGVRELRSRLSTELIRNSCLVGFSGG